MNWLTFFADSIEQIQDSFAIVLQAWGCREGWLQGELFRLGRDNGLRVNEHRLGAGRKADVSAPGMIGEIKIVGADYQSKMQWFIESDVERIRQVTGTDIEKYMILIIPYSNAETRLGAYLDSCSFCDRCGTRECRGFRLRIWQF